MAEQGKMESNEVYKLADYLYKLGKDDPEIKSVIEHAGFAFKPTNHQHGGIYPPMVQKCNNPLHVGATFRCPIHGDHTVCVVCTACMAEGKFDCGSLVYDRESKTHPCEAHTITDWEWNGVLEMNKTDKEHWKNIMMRHREADDRKVSIVYQDHALFPHLSVRENILFGLKMRKEKPAKMNSRLNWVVLLLGINYLLHRKPATLIGGERQKVALARAIITEPELLLIDEPLSALDPETRENVQQELRQLHQAVAGAHSCNAEAGAAVPAPASNFGTSCAVGVSAGWRGARTARFRTSSTGPASCRRPIRCRSRRRQRRRRTR